MKNNMQKLEFIRNSRGQSLIEIVVTLGILAVLLTVSAITVTTSLQNTRSSRYQSQAGTYAKQGIEIIRQMRDVNFSNFNTFSGAYCLADGCNELSNSGSCGPKSGSCGINAGEFSREVTLTKNDAQCSVGGINITKATVTVSWADNTCPNNVYCRKVSIDGCFANLNSVSN